MLTYIGITIGPIFDTIMEASTPAALWFASSMFSDITRRLCEEISNEENFTNVQIISPYYSKGISNKDGVGKFHDRIIFSTEKYDNEKMKIIISKVKRDTKQYFLNDTDKAAAFLEEYLQIHYVVLEQNVIEDKNCILALSPYLNVMELMKSFPNNNSDNPIKKLFLGENNKTNKYVKENPLFHNISLENNQFINNKTGAIWLIDEIASNHGKSKSGLKLSNYYAVVQADGDNMSDFLETLSTGNNYKDNDKLANFSLACLNYDEAAAKEIGDFGGMTIYAGGDDLLFLAPLESENGETIFKLCNKINNLFKQKVQEMESLNGINVNIIPTISFGISIQYRKYPLYEALSNAIKLLQIAKDEKSNKNRMVIELQKHSGQSKVLNVPHDAFAKFEEILVLDKKYSKEETINSVMYTLSKFRFLIYAMNSKVNENKMNYVSYEEAWMNLFGNPEQERAKKYIKEICKIYYDKFVDNDVAPDSTLRTFLDTLWLKKFMVEKGDM